MDEREFIEETGLVFEQRGIPRMAGRVLGFLMICDPPEQTMQAITAALQASKGAISTTNRMLVQMGMIERLSLPGKRADFYRIAPNFWSQSLEQAIEEFASYRQLAEQGLQLLEDAPPERKTRLMDMYTISLFMEGEAPGLIEKWRRLRDSQGDETEA